MSEKQFRGWWTPKEIVSLFESGEISALETILLNTIDSLVSEDRGCFASNEYLAGKMGVSITRISHMITKLKRLKVNGIPLILEVGFNGRLRFLETAWSRIGQNHHRQKSVGSVVNYDSEKSLGNETGQKRQGGPVESDQPVKSNLTKRNRRDKGRSKKKKQVCGRTPSAARTNNSNTSSRNYSNSKPHMDSTDRKLALYAKEILVLHDTDISHTKIGTVGVQIARLRQERKVSVDRIKRVLDFLRKEYQDQYTPKVRKVTDFFTKFKRMEEAIDRHESSNGNGKDVTRETMYDDCYAPGQPRIWVDHDGIQYDGRLVNRCRKVLGEMFPKAQEEILSGTFRPTQTEVDEILEGLGEQAGSMKPSALMG